MLILYLKGNTIHTIFKVLIISLVTFSVNAQVRPLVHKDEKRKYIVYTPQSYATSPDKKYPVVFNFHGGGMTMAEQMLYTKMNHTADKHDFIVVYPQGIKQDWNVGFGMSYTEGTDDIGFTEAVLNAVEKNFVSTVPKYLQRVYHAMDFSATVLLLNLAIVFLPLPLLVRLFLRK